MTAATAAGTQHCQASRATSTAVHAARLAAQLNDLFHSRSWRITAPLRLIATLYRRLRAAIREGRLGSGSKRRLKALLRRCGHALLRRPRLAAAAMFALKRLPGLKNRLRGILFATVPAGTATDIDSDTYTDTDINNDNAPAASARNYASPRAQRILAELVQAIAARKP